MTLAPEFEAVNKFLSVYLTCHLHRLGSHVAANLTSASNPARTFTLFNTSVDLKSIFPYFYFQAAKVGPK